MTLLNTTNNAGSSIWKTMSTRLTTLDPVQAASSLPSMLQGHAAVPNLSVRGLRGVRFRMDCLTVTYPLLDHLAPQEEAATRTRVNEAHISFLQSLPNTWTNNQQLVGFYDECCCSREEMGLPRIRSALLGLDSPLKEMDLTGLQLNVGAAEALSDVLSLDFGLKKLILDSCGLDDEVRCSSTLFLPSIPAHA